MECDMNATEIKLIQRKYNLSEDYIKDNVNPVIKENCGCKNELHNCSYYDTAKHIYLNVKV
jgi:hypothetical protein